MTNRNGTTLTWYASLLPKAITLDANNSSIFEYGPGRARWRHIYKTGGTTYTHTYIGTLMEKVVSGATTSYKHYLALGGGAQALYIRSSTGSTDSYYLLSDHLGSTDRITNASGSSVVAESFDPFGDRRGTNWSGDPTSGELSTINGITRRGYTDHEMLDSTAMVHMNGRVFEPTIGRFVSADPVKDCGLGTQGRNRYSYVGNRSLSLRDRSGFYVEDGQDQWWDSPITPRDLQESLDLQQNLYEMGLDYEWNRGNVPLTDPAPATPECEQASWRCAQSGDYWCEEAQRLGCYPNADAYPSSASSPPSPGTADPGPPLPPDPGGPGSADPTVGPSGTGSPSIPTVDGTLDCSYYKQRCDETGDFYYCRLAPAVCRDFPDSAWSRCVRDCLQWADAAECDRKGGDPLCIINIHQMCWEDCIDLDHWYR